MANIVKLQLENGRVRTGEVLSRNILPHNCEDCGRRCWDERFAQKTAREPLCSTCENARHVEFMMAMEER